nr:hypothetical protein [Tanacetum cinerariifolium]
MEETMVKMKMAKVAIQMKMAKMEKIKKEIMKMNKTRMTT